MRKFAYRTSILLGFIIIVAGTGFIARHEIQRIREGLPTFTHSAAPIRSERKLKLTTVEPLDPFEFDEWRDELLFELPELELKHDEELESWDEAVEELFAEDFDLE